MTRVAIVGAGAIGLATGYALRRRGHEVLILDSGPPGAGCTRGNAGWITPSISSPVPAPGLTLKSIKWMLRPDSPLYLAPSALPGLARWLWRFWRFCNPRDFVAGLRATAALNQTTLAAFDALERDGVRIELHRRGLLFVFLDPRESEPVLAEFEHYRDFGYGVPEPLDGDALRRMEPGLSNAVRAGFHVPEEYHVRPESLAAGYVDRIGQLGGVIRSGVQVTGARATGDRITALDTSAGPVEADEFLIAAGARTGELVRRFGPSLPVEAGKGYSLTMATGGPVFSRPLYLGEAKIGCSPFDGAVRFAGTMELSGINERFDRRRMEGLRNAIGRYFDGSFQLHGEEWVGMRPLAPDGLPLLGRVPGFRNLSVATGHSMLGITLAPATGEAMAALLSGKPVPVLEPFAPGRFNW
ncbi:MAG: NAD(P)/FAD-dependent oxidoreductase [Gemmatimonadales bacterium]